MRKAEHGVQLKPQFPRPKNSRSVIGIRHDAADAHRIQVEEEKPPRARPLSPPGVVANGSTETGLGLERLFVEEPQFG
jgi:hypothetical protein